MTFLDEKLELMKNANNIIGFFPGLGSRIEYKEIGDFLLRDGDDDTENIYREAALAMGYGNNPEKMMITSATLPVNEMERQGFIGASFVTHNLVLMSKLKLQARQQNQVLNFLAYSGESFGIISSAIASGSLSINDGVKIANFFTPYILLASDRKNDYFSSSITSFHPKELKDNILISEGYYVVGLRGTEKTLTEIHEELESEFLNTEVELHKFYSQTQMNFYVNKNIKSSFDMFMKSRPHITVMKLKDPTTFIPHSKQLSLLKKGLESFILNQNIVFHDPHTPIIANHSDKLLFSKEEVKLAIFAILDEEMHSASTAKKVDSLGADAIIELGLGNKSVDMLRDNNILSPVFSYTGDMDEAKLIVHALGVLNEIRLSDSSEELSNNIAQWLEVARENSDLATILEPKIVGAINNVGSLKLEVSGNLPVSIDSIYKNSWYYRGYLQTGELVLMARQKRNIFGGEHDKSNIYADLKILTHNKSIRYLKTPYFINTEKNLFCFSSLDNLGNSDVYKYLQELEAIPNYKDILQLIQSEYKRDGSLNNILQMQTVHARPEIQIIRRIFLQYIVFKLMKIHRPGLVKQNNTYLVSCSFVGWVACLLTAEAVSIDGIIQFCLDYFSPVDRSISIQKAVDKFTAEIIDATVPIISISGQPVMTFRDLDNSTYNILAHDFTNKRVQATLDCHLLVFTLDNYLENDSLEIGPYKSEIILINSIKDICWHDPNNTLEKKEREIQSQLTEEYNKLFDYATRRNLLCSTINAYINADEMPILFCDGGSESMTMFVKRAPHDPIIVRKILSEALTATKWQSGAKGAMLPPFEKAARQVDYIRALPDNVKPLFPQIYNVIEREILTPTSQKRVGKKTCKEVIYEMSLVEGEEVSQFIKRNNIAPQIIARIYEVIFILLRDTIHQERKVLVNGNTFEISYFKKIEDRLALSQQTAPNIFDSKLLDSEMIEINGNEYLNIKALLRTFRSHPEYISILEPRYHSLVMGDTNTENIKIGNTLPLLEIQKLIEKNESKDKILRALSSINAKNIELRFLDPRAIGYQSEGADCNDDYMYDNKPWHNSIGHYDEIHNELFTLNMKINEKKIPSIDIHFISNNSFQQAYKIADCAARNINPLEDHTIVGMERYFAQVMNTVYESTNPESAYLKEDPYWLVRFVFIMGTHFAAMPPFHFSSELDGTIKDSIQTQIRPVAIYCEGIKWLNWALEILQGHRNNFLGINVPFIEMVSMREVV